MNNHASTYNFDLIFRACRVIKNTIVICILNYNCTFSTCQMHILNSSCHS